MQSMSEDGLRGVIASSMVCCRQFEGLVEKRWGSCCIPVAMQLVTMGSEILEGSPPGQAAAARSVLNGKRVSVITNASVSWLGERGYCDPSGGTTFTLTHAALWLPRGSVVVIVLSECLTFAVVTTQLLFTIRWRR